MNLVLDCAECCSAQGERPEIQSTKRARLHLHDDAIRLSDDFIRRRAGSKASRIHSELAPSEGIQYMAMSAEDPVKTCIGRAACM